MNKQTDVLRFIDLYKSREVLWNMNVAIYRRNDLKVKAYKYIAAECKMSTEDVKKKIKSLRTVYSREKAKLEGSKRSGCDSESVYQPSVFWYNEMDFLASLIRRKTVDNSNQEFLPQPKKAKQILEIKRNDLLMRAVNSLESEKKDDTQILSDSWGSLYKKLDARQQLFANKAINEVLYQGALGNLTETSCKAFDKQPNFQATSIPAASVTTSPYFQSSNTSISNYSDEPVYVSTPLQSPQYTMVRPVPTRLIVAHQTPKE